MNPRTELDQGVWEILVMAQVAAEVAKGNLSFIYASVMEAILLTSFQTWLALYCTNM